MTTTSRTYTAIMTPGITKELTAREVLTNCQAGILGFAEPDDKAYFAQQHVAAHPSMFERQMIERAIIRQAVRDILASPVGYSISIHDGEAFACKKSRDVAVIMEAIMSTDEDRLLVYAPDSNSEAGWKRIGTLLLVYGNDGWDVMADSSGDIVRKALLNRAKALADELGDMLNQAPALLPQQRHGIDALDV